VSTLTERTQTESTLTVSTEAVTQFARRLEMLANDIDAWVVRARVTAALAHPAHRQNLEAVSDGCARVADHLRADALSAQRAAETYEENESWWAGTAGLGASGMGATGLGATALAGVAAFLAPSPLTVSALRHSITGLSSTIAGVAAIAGAALRTSGAAPASLSVRSVSRTDCLLPVSFAAAVERIPAADPHAAQVRVEKTPSAAFVYIGGTVTSSLLGGSEPWDMTSNIAAMVGQTSDSERGARAALTAAGVTNADRIVVVGHSQGGLVAQRLASDPQLRVSDVVLVGSPQTPGSVAPGVHVVALEHRNDPIPALGGMAPEGRADVTVATTPPITPGDPLAAHHASVYRDLAAEADASRHPALISVRREIFGAENAACQATEWRVDRAR
jgi:dienelactone hydrolase